MTPAAVPSPTLIDQSPPRASFLAEVLRGLRLSAKELPCKYFYDEAGSQLFERICRLEEYYLGRCGLEIVRRHAAEMARRIGPGCELIEYGSGSGVQTRLLLEQLDKPRAYLPIDLSRETLLESARALAAHLPALEVVPVCADFTRKLEVARNGAARRVVFFAGSTIGNFTPPQAMRLLQQTARLCGPGGGMLLAADLKKDPAVIERAYNDSQGVTAAFNLNLLARINRELGADFALEQFWHHALYNPRDGRIEMHLVGKADQSVRVGGEVFFIAEGEAICTEFSYKYSLRDLQILAEKAGFTLEQVWTDERRWFCIVYLSVPLAV